MKKYSIALSVLFLFVCGWPNADLAPYKKGGCSLISSANANVPPPIEECYAKKIGDHCYTKTEGLPGVCEEVCLETDTALCKSDKARKRPQCMPCNPQRKNCPEYEGEKNTGTVSNDHKI